MKHFSLFVFLLALYTLQACKKDKGPDEANNTEKVAPDGFNYTTSKSVSVNIRLLSNSNEPLKGVPVEVISPKSGEVLIKAVSNNDGYVKSSVNIPAYLDTVTVKPNYVGLVQDVKAIIKDNTISCVIGGSEGLSGNVVLDLKPADGLSFFGKSSASALGTAFSYMGTYDSKGRPNYLEAQSGAVSANLLASINASLPENQSVYELHPEYINDNATQNLNITATTDVYITFISEGAGYYNALGYYTYPTDNPPNNRNKIDNIKYVFPNTSALGSGGGMRSGDRVKLGSFSAGTTVALVLFQNGWSNSTKTVDNGVTKYYSDKDLNPEPNGTLEIHSILLNYSTEKIFVMGWEDLPRSHPAGDNDFNDLLIYASSSTANAISTSGVTEVKSPDDDDQDGVQNTLDEFPNDASKAYVNYFPSENTWGTLAFEDNWPKKGDYDVNDLVVNYRYAMVSNAQNNVVEMTADFAPTAAGASFYNGFGVEFPFASTAVSSVTGYKFISDYISLNSNGTEAGQSKAVIIPFDNHEALVKNPNGAFFINTKEEKEKVAGDTAHVSIQFSSPLTQSQLGQAPFNPFLISNMRRGYEIHLPGYTPTSKANTSLFGTDDDNSSSSAQRYYLTKENAPWGLSFTETFSYPSEFNAIGNAYLHFTEWAGSNGSLYPDWYKSTESGYRDQSKIYSK